MCRLERAAEGDGAGNSTTLLEKITSSRHGSEVLGPEETGDER
jgi:hypothetical protein